MCPPGGDSPSSAGTRVWLPEGVPARLGSYEILRPLDRGGMGMVFEARHRLLEQRVAVKVMHPQLSRNEHFVSRFRREMAALGRMAAHPNLVRAHYAGEEQGVLYLAMDLVEGIDLRDLARQRGPLPVAEACAAIRQAARGLEAIHEAGLVHRDIKPSNLMLCRDGTVKVLDLGLARLRDPGQEELTPTSMQMGTYDYQAPEQATDPRAVDIRADIYSLGCTLYRLLMGRPPFGELATPAMKIFAHAHHDFPALDPAIPAAVGAVLARMVARDPRDRFAGPRELGEALEPLARGADLAGLFVEPSRRAEPPAGSEAPTRDEQRGATLAAPPQADTATRTASQSTANRLAVGGAGVLVAGALVGVFLISPGWKQEPGPAGTVTPEGTSLEQDRTDPILAAGSQPRSLDELAPYEAHDLLEQAPVQALWDRADGAAFRTFDPALKQLIVQSPGDGMFHLGTISKPSWTFQVQIKQPHWSRGVGIYLGCREPASGAGEPCFQYLLFSQRTDVAGKPVFVLSRGKGRLVPVRKGRLIGTDDVMGEDIETPQQEAWLIVEVLAGRLHRVRVNGVELKRLTALPVNNKFAPEDYQGCLGLFATAGGCVFHRASLTLFPDR